LAEPLWKFDANIVREYCANAWAKRQDRRPKKTMGRGKWISYSPQAIDDFLGNPFPRQEEKCHYQRLCSRKKKDLVTGMLLQLYVYLVKGIRLVQLYVCLTKRSA